MATYEFQGSVLDNGQTALVDEILAVFPALTGTDKRIAFARDVRVKMTVNAVRMHFHARCADSTYRSQVVATFRDAAPCKVFQTTDAKRWIDAWDRPDHRDVHSLMDVVNGKILL